MVFIVSMRASRKRLALGLLCGGAVVLCLAVLFLGGRGDAPVQPTAASVTVDTNGERIEYLKSFGWTVTEEACEIVEVAIPTEFGDVYQNYNAIQKEQGFDLTAYRGKRVKRYSYEVTNYPNQQENVRANLLVYNNQIIGGDVCSLELDGFMHGFQLPR